MYLIKSKEEEALDTLIVRFVQDAIIPNVFRLERLRSDCGGEYTAGYCRKYCKSVGIVQEYSAPAKPQQNGISERAGWTLMNIVRCLLRGGNLSSSLCGENMLYCGIYYKPFTPRAFRQSDALYYNVQQACFTESPVSYWLGCICPCGNTHCKNWTRPSLGRAFGRTFIETCRPRGVASEPIPDIRSHEGKPSHATRGEIPPPVSPVSVPGTRMDISLTKTTGLLIAQMMSRTARIVSSWTILMNLNRKVPKMKKTAYIRATRTGLRSSSRNKVSPRSPMEIRINKQQQAELRRLAMATQEQVRIKVPS